MAIRRCDTHLHHAPAHPRWARSATPAVLLAIALALPLGCGSDDGAPEAGNRQQAVEDPADVGATDASFCETVAQVAQAEVDGDTLAMATALELLLDDLPDEVAGDVQAYIDGLEAAPPNQAPAPDSSENETAEVAYREYAEETCGADATGGGGGSSSGSTTTTGTESPTTARPGAGDSGQAGG